jgi:hypothetical protein
MHMSQRRLTVSLDDDLEQALADAPDLLGLPVGASASEKLRAYARHGYGVSLEAKRDEARLATYREWADAPEVDEAASAFRTAASLGAFRDG